MLSYWEMQELKNQAEQARKSAEFMAGFRENELLGQGGHSGVRDDMHAEEARAAEAERIANDLNAGMTKRRRGG